MQTLGCLPLLMGLFLLIFGVGMPVRPPEPPVSMEVTAIAVSSSSLSAPTLGISMIPVLEPQPKDDAELLKRYDHALQLSVDAGVKGMFLSNTWKEMEPSAGQFNFDYINGMKYAELKGINTVLVAIQLINTTDKETPTDLLDVSFDSPQMIERFRLFFDALLPKLDQNVKYISIGNEVDVYFSTHTEVDSYRKFYEAALDYVHQKAPWVQVGVTCTFGGASGPQQQICATLNTRSDVIILTYYPLDAGFKPYDPDVPLKDFPKMVEMAGGKPVVLQEVGYPAGTLLDSSDKDQAAFVKHVFAAWRKAGSSIPFLNYFLLHDMTQKMCDDFSTYYGLPNVKPFNVFLCTLGLRTADGTPREGWQVFVDEAKQGQ
jgi:hypothetical protein